MDDRKVPYYLHEATIARFERSNKRLIVVLVLTIILLFLTNLAWLYVWQSYDYVSGEESVTVDGGDGITNYIGNDGDISNGDYNSSTSPEIENEE